MASYNPLKSSLDCYIRDYSSIFIQPMNLSEPNEDILGFVKVCAVDFSQIGPLVNSKLNHPIKLERGRVLPSFVVRLWSRSSMKYVSIIEDSGSVYARTPFGPNGHFRLILDDDKVLLQSTKNKQQYLGMVGHSFTGQGVKNQHSYFLVRQDVDGFCTFESVTHPGLYLGVRKNGNIMSANQVDSACHCAHFVVQKEAEEVLH